MDERRARLRSVSPPRTLSVRITEELAARMIEHCQGIGVAMDDAVATALELMLRERVERTEPAPS